MKNLVKVSQGLLFSWKACLASLDMGPARVGGGPAAHKQVNGGELLDLNSISEEGLYAAV